MALRTVVVVSAAVFLVFISQVKSNQENLVRVTCDAGTFLGNERTFPAFGRSYTVNQFLGIPYAEPPIGERRFKKPVRKASLTEPYDAREYGASCFGLDMAMEGIRKPDQQYKQAEDCLFLNVFTPNRGENEELLPVLMFIHGGGFNLGSATLYPGDILSGYGEVIFVTINYRLNIWGFLSTGDEVSPGNYGLWDQQMAIQWIHNNIKAFGGDPDRITISGNSAGSASVIYQAMFLGNNGLIKGLIPQSGSPRCPWAFNDNPFKAAMKAGRLLDCNMQDSQELVQCIKSKSSKQIMNAMNDGEPFKIFPMEFVTVVDGDFIKHSPHELLNEHSKSGSEERKLLSSYDMMTGVTTNEALMMLTDFVGVQRCDDFTINKEGFLHGEIPKVAKIMFAEDATEVVEEILKTEYFPWDNPDNDTEVREAFLRLNSDYVFNIQAVQTANVHSFQTNKNTFFYQFDALPSQHILTTPAWSDKPNHCDEITFLLGFDSDAGYTAWTTPFTEEAPKDWELELSKTVMTMWSNFARSGNPNIPKDIKVTWPRYTPKNQEALRISREMRSDSSVQLHPHAKAVNLWYNTLPSVIKATKNLDGLQYCSKPDA